MQSVPGSDGTGCTADPETRQTRLKFSSPEQRIAYLDGQMVQDASDHTLLLQHELSEKIQAQK